MSLLLLRELYRPLHKLYEAGIIPLKKSLEQTETLATSTFCRRRLPIVLVRLKFAETVKEAVTFVEHGRKCGISKTVFGT